MEVWPIFEVAVFRPTNFEFKKTHWNWRRSYFQQFLSICSEKSTVSLKNKYCAMSHFGNAHEVLLCENRFFKHAFACFFSIELKQTFFHVSMIDICRYYVRLLSNRLYICITVNIYTTYLYSVYNLKKNCAMVFHANAFSISQCQHFALTHDGLHIFNINRIQITIETYIAALLKCDQAKQNCNVYMGKKVELTKLKCRCYGFFVFVFKSKRIRATKIE